MTGRSEAQDHCPARSSGGEQGSTTLPAVFGREPATEVIDDGVSLRQDGPMGNVLKIGVAVTAALIVAGRSGPPSYSEDEKRELRESAYQQDILENLVVTETRFDSGSGIRAGLKPQPVCLPRQSTSSIVIFCPCVRSLDRG